MRFIITLVVTLIIMSAPALAQKPNRLVATSSPYLLQHAYNPVDWYPWGDEALDKAKKENKPIFLSIGYSTCYWCHVMEREVFEKQDVAEIINKYFVSIKIDREQRPDLDEIYMTATNMINGQGGWPNSLFLTPDLKPFFASTYIPHDQFISLLNNVAKNWSEKEDALRQQSTDIASHIKSYFAEQQKSGDSLPSGDIAKQYFRYLQQSFDNREGGFGAGVKFPGEMALWFLLDYHKATGDAEALAMAQLTLEKMAAGGIHDHIGGGFHRYSTDPLWHIPHFEKMLYNQAMLARAYSELFALSNYPHHKDIVEQIFAYTARQMTGKKGQFYSALDAETDAIEGDYYVWRKEEVKNLLSKENYALFGKIFTMQDLPVFGGHKHTEGQLIYMKKPMMDLAFDLSMPYDQLLDKIKDIRAVLLKSRLKRKRPRLDDKTITAWSGLMIDAYARAAMVTDNAEYIKRAAKAADFILKNMRNEKGELYRIYSKNAAYQPAYMEDYAYFIQGLASLYRVGHGKRFLEAAQNLTAIADNLFLDKTNGGYYFAEKNPNLLAYSKQATDSATPSANAVMANAMIDLYEETGEATWKEKAENIIKAFAANMEKSPPAYGHLIDAFLRLQHISPLKKQSSSTERKITAQVSADKVDISARIVKDNPLSIEVTMQMADGWHINANPASLDFLIPTSVDIQSDIAIKVKTTYPEAQKLSGPFGPIDIYEKNAVIRADISPHIAQGTELRILAQIQACKGSTCLAPSDVILKITK